MLLVLAADAEHPLLRDAMYEDEEDEDEQGGNQESAQAQQDDQVGRPAYLPECVDTAS
jgi:hypothetical protein